MDRNEWKRQYNKRPEVKEATRLYNKRPDVRARRDAHTKDIAKRHRAVLNEAKNVPCTDCGGRFHPAVMDLHHLDPSTKAFGFDQLHARALTTLEAEIAKCVPLCANCHRERTWTSCPQTAQA